MPTNINEEVEQGPIPPRRPTVLEAHGDRRIDDWYWLRDRGNEEVLGHLMAENNYTESQTAPLETLEKQIYQEILGRIRQTDIEVPVRYGPYLYYSKTVEGKDYPIHLRRALEATNEATDAVDQDGAATPLISTLLESEGDIKGVNGLGEERVVLDVNELADGQEHFDLSDITISPDHRLAAYSYDTTGSERYTIAIRDIETGNDLLDSIPDTSPGVAWANDNKQFFYTRLDEVMRPYQVLSHAIGTPIEEDRLIYEEEDDRFHLMVTHTKDRRFILIVSESKITSEIRVLDANYPAAPPLIVEPRRQGIQYSLEHQGDRLIMLTNEDALNFRLMIATDPRVATPTWEELVPHRSDVRIEDFEVFSNHIVLYERVDASRRIVVMDMPSKRMKAIELPETTSTCFRGANPEYQSRILRYEYSSMITPRSTYDYDMSTEESKLLKRQPVGGDFDPTNYRTTRLWAPAHDSKLIPISIVHRKDVMPDGSNPLLLYGYGAYEYSVDPVFSPIRLSLLDRGFVYAIAHVRGGGELGREWYEGGKLANKKNTFMDYIQAAKYLISEGWTNPAKLVIRGGSAGGMLIGAALNLEPELFKAAVAEVPFVDCLTTMMDPTLPLTAIEWEEWGNPIEDPEIYWYMRSYSPYDNVQERVYPEMLVTTGLNDPRVGFHEPVKWVAKLRAANPSNRVLLKADLGTGHMGPTSRYKAWEEEAFILAFIVNAVDAETNKNTVDGSTHSLGKPS